MSLESKFRKKDTIADRRIADDSFLVPICGQPGDLQNIFVLNPMADFIWQRLDGERSLQDLLGEIVGHFAVEPQQARSDMLEFVGQLQEQNLLDEVA